jgi:hypothetical protein
VAVTDSLATQFLRHYFDDLTCPRCGFGMWVRFAEVVAGVTVVCPVCRSRCALVDDRAQLQTLGVRVEAEVRRGFAEGMG